MSNHAAEYWTSMREKYGTGEPKRTFGEWSVIHWGDLKLGVPKDEALIMLREQTENPHAMTT